GAVFHRSLEYVAELRMEHGWLLYFLPISGILIVFCYRICGVGYDRGTNMVLDSIHSSETMFFRTTPLFFIGTLLTHVCAGSSGREGSALRIGGSQGSSMGRAISWNEREGNSLVRCVLCAVST